MAQITFWSKCYFCMSPKQVSGFLRAKAIVCTHLSVLPMRILVHIYNLKITELNPN